MNLKRIHEVTTRSFCGYWNMVKHKEDKSSTCGKIISNKFFLSWEALKLTLDVSEPTKSMENLKYSWDKCFYNKFCKV